MSSPNTRLVLSAEADDDLADLLNQSVMRWGEEQARRYAQAIERAFALLSNNPNLGRLRADLQPDLRSYPVQRHIIVYPLRDDTLIVMRILHGRMDITRALREMP